MENVWLLWIDHEDSYELVGVYSQEFFAERDSKLIEPKTFIQERELNVGKSIFLEK